MLVTSEQRGEIVVIALDNPPVNAMGFEVRAALKTAVETAIEDDSIKAVVLTGKGRCFSAGADINEFGKPRRLPYLSDLATALELSPKPIVAALHGAAVGGGTELALGCHYRIAALSARVGLPEVLIGQFPGAGGAQRLPRLIGFEPALRVILSGTPLPVSEARELGFFDAIADDDLVGEAVEFARRLVSNGKGPRPTRDIPVDVDAATEAIAAARQKVERKSRGLDAPRECVNAVERILTMPIDEALIEDRKQFDALAAGAQAKAQRHLFFARSKAHKLTYLTKSTAVRAIGSVGVVGGGTMGRGIAANLAAGGFDVTIVENDPDLLEHVGSQSRALLRGDPGSMGKIETSSDLNDLADASLVIEAVFEDMEIKHKVFGALSSICDPQAILATNTSSLDIGVIADAVHNPGRVVGMHYFSPAHVMKLLEVVKADVTSPETIATVLSVAKTIGKIPVVVGVCDGFVGNRMLYAYREQAEYLLEDGALPEQVDAMIRSFGFPMGPFEIGDLSGLDVGYSVREQRRKSNPNPERYSSTVADRLVEMGRLGRKTGAGWYRYETGSRTPLPDAEVADLIEQRSRELGKTRRKIDDEEIFRRCLFALINEGAKCLEDGTANRASDIDLVWCHGYGFPVAKGGPMFYADEIGPAEIFETLTDLAKDHGKELEPAKILRSLAEQGGSFADLQA